MGPKTLVLQLRPRISCPVTTALLRAQGPHCPTPCGCEVWLCPRHGNGEGKCGCRTWMGHELPVCWPGWEPSPSEDKGQPGRVWASHPVAAATLALEVALGVLLMAHMGKLRHRALRAPPRVSQCMGAPTHRPHHFRPTMDQQAWCAFACLLPPGHFGGQVAHGQLKSIHLTAPVLQELRSPTPVSSG